MSQSPAPTFALPACPACSTLVFAVSPFWRYAHNTSRARKRNAYLFSGCEHAAAACRPDKIVDDPEEWGLVEDAWGALVAQLFAAKTERWTSVQATRFRNAIESKSTLPGATEPLDFGEKDPAALAKTAPISTPLVRSLRAEIEAEESRPF